MSSLPADVTNEPHGEEPADVHGRVSDEAWYAQVYRPLEPQFTWRAVVSGCVIGSVLSAANLYTGFTIGITYGASITAALSAWLVFRLFRAVASGPAFTVLENNTMQTAASAAAAMAGAGMVTAVPALMIVTNRRLSILEIATWLVSAALLGVLFAIPLKRQMINRENLKFPSGIAAAQTTLALHGEGEGGKQKAVALLAATAIGAALGLARGGLGFVPDAVPFAFASLGGMGLARLTMGLDVSLMTLGSGALVGLRTTAWMAAGATLCWVFVVPWALGRGLVTPTPNAPTLYGDAVGFTVWPGVAMLVVGGLVSFALKGGSIATAFRSLGGAMGAKASGEVLREDVEVPRRWFAWGLAAAVMLAIGVQWLVFGLHPATTLLAIVLAGALALVGTRTMGETDVNPIGPMAMVTQLLFAVLTGGHTQASLMAAGLTNAGANSCGDMMQDLKTGRLLGASPQKQLLAQLFGLVTGGLATALVFAKAFPLELLGTKYPAPGVQMFKGTAELLTRGFAGLPEPASLAMAIAAGFAVVCTIASELGPKRFAAWVPSPLGIGLAFILPASTSFTLFLGAAIAAVLAWKFPKRDELYTIATASGFVAGESVMGVAVAIWAAGRT
ncbi:OPT family oligopeptide transporter [Polyangium jinanense]|uniref:OPT/YSL family transporter n=1 Tax=Polyangium jinanense TaxID=2829994 RepID=A0A9X3WYN5_9BACT|nr:OPT family oligopeptide transporter [Polyangium jinanense]MDC3954469.1 OPT/YSL family transporter [Polyangium jinanense]MDC3980772.1 OPT/YSL family transporter [Polyangium jinanense]